PAAFCAVSPLAIIYGGYFSSELPALVLLPAGLWLVEGCVALARTTGSARTINSVKAVAGAAAAAGAAVVLLLVVRQQFALNLAIAGAPLVVLARGRTGRV